MGDDRAYCAPVSPPMRRARTTDGVRGSCGLVSFGAMLAGEAVQRREIQQAVADHALGVAGSPRPSRPAAWAPRTSSGTQPRRVVACSVSRQRPELGCGAFLNHSTKRLAVAISDNSSADGGRAIWMCPGSKRRNVERADDERCKRGNPNGNVDACHLHGPPQNNPKELSAG